MVLKSLPSTVRENLRDRLSRTIKLNELYFSWTKVCGRSIPMKPRMVANLTSKECLSWTLLKVCVFTYIGNSRAERQSFLDGSVFLTSSHLVEEWCCVLRRMAAFLAKLVFDVRFVV